MIGKHLYEDTAVGATKGYTFGGTDFASDEYARFIASVEELEGIGAAGDLEITHRHREAMSGHRHLVGVMFKRLR